MDHQTIAAERGRRAEDLRAAAVAALEQDPLAVGVLLDLDDDTCVAAGPKAAILMLLNGAGESKAQLQAAAPSDLQKLKALELAATPGDELPELPEPLEIVWPELHRQALGCGIEDRGITDRYEAAEHGWECGMERAIECVPELLYEEATVLEIQRAAYELGKARAAASAATKPALLDHAHAEPSKITNTISARAFVDEWHLKHFPTDRTFSRYIKGDTERNQLAGDFAWQLAKALEAGEVSHGAAPTAADVRDLTREQIIELVSDIYLQDFQGPGYDLAIADAVLRAAGVRAAQPNIQEAGNA